MKYCNLELLFQTTNVRYGKVRCILQCVLGGNTIIQAGFKKACTTYINPKIFWSEMYVDDITGSSKILKSF